MSSFIKAGQQLLPRLPEFYGRAYYMKMAVSHHGLSMNDKVSPHHANQHNANERWIESDKDYF